MKRRTITMLSVGIALFNAKALFVGGCFIPKAHANTAQKDIQTSATVSPRCTFASGSVALQFGSYDPTQNINVDSSTLFDIRCTKGAAVTLGLDNGDYSSGANRRMKNMSVSNNEYLRYQLYSNTARTTVWNNTNTVNFTSTSAANHGFTIYGRIPSGQNSVKGGTYNDTVTITATF